MIFVDDYFFNKFSPKIIIEPHMYQNSLTTDKCIADLTKYGYSCKVIPQPGSGLPLIECIK